MAFLDRFLVREARALGLEVIDRCNLTVLLEPGPGRLSSTSWQPTQVLYADLSASSPRLLHGGPGDDVLSLHTLTKPTRWVITRNVMKTDEAEAYMVSVRCRCRAAVYSLRLRIPGPLLPCRLSPASALSAAQHQQHTEYNESKGCYGVAVIW